MTDQKTWLVTGARCGTGAELATAAPAAGHDAVATGATLPPSSSLLHDDVPVNA